MKKDTSPKIILIYPQLTPEKPTIDFVNNLNSVDRLLKILDRHLEEKIPENERTDWLFNAGLTGIYYRLMLEGMQSSSRTGTK